VRRDQIRVGIAGFGKMGSAMAARLVETGCDLQIWNRDSGRVAAAGFTPVATPRDLATRCDIVISSLFDAEAVEAVYSGPDGLIAGGVGTLFVEMSTVSPDSQRSIAEMARAGRAAFIECPVSGTTGPARTGQLFGFAAGEEPDVDRARAVLQHLCRRIEHVGPVGSGTTTKLAVNLPLIAFWQAFGEAMALMKPLAKAPDWLVELFSDTADAPAVLKVKAAAVTATLAGDDTVEPTFEIDAMRKDLQLMLDEHRDLPVAISALSAMDEASKAGWGKRDCAWMPAFWMNIGT
jgi:3-hydroxyisobutyrate dehydrogenase